MTYPVGMAPEMQNIDQDNLDFVIDAEEVKRLKVKLVDEVYSIMPPKASITLKIASRATAGTDSAKGRKKKKAEEIDPAELQNLSTMVEDWVKLTFDKEDAEKVLARLDDPSDRLDVEHIMKLIEALVEKSALARPTS